MRRRLDEVHTRDTVANGDLWMVAILGIQVRAKDEQYAVSRRWHVILKSR